MPELVAVDFNPFKSPSNPGEFASRYGAAAEKAGKALGVDPQVLLGQWGLETGWGKSVIPGTNNLGNIKDFSGSGTSAKDNMTGSVDKYRTYESPEAFADDFTSLIQRKYPGAVGAKDPQAFAQALKAGGYAEDPRYVDKVVQASRMAGSRPNPVMAAVGNAVESVIPSAQAAEAGPQLVPVDFDPFSNKVSAQPNVKPGKREKTLVEKAINVAAAISPIGGLVDAATDGKASIGAVRGVKDVIDTGANLLSRLGGSEEQARVQAMNEAGKQDFQQTYGDSTAASLGRVGGNVLATAPVGGVLGGVARAAGATRLGNALASGGFTVGAPAATIPGAVGNMALRMAGGAGTGATSAALIDPASAGLGAGVGAALPPVARVAGALGGAVSGTARAVRDMGTQAGQQQIAANILQRSATNPEQAAQNLLRARPVVPGSNPTIAQVAQDPGLAQLERTLVNSPETAAPLQQRFAQQRAARGTAIDEVAATGPESGSYYDDIVEGRRIFANEDYAAARQAGIDPEMAASMQPEIASLMERPSIQAAVVDARRLAAETGENIADLGSVQGLDWVKKALDNQISRANRGNNSIGAEDLRALMRTRDDLNATLEQLAPAYREANRNYAQMSRQINSMDVARDLERRYTPAAGNFGLSAREQGTSYMRGLREAQDSVRRSTGRDMSLGDTMGTADIFALENVARDLARVQYAQEAGRAVGSPTAQNMLSQYFINRVLSESGLPQSVITGAQGSTVVNSLLRPVEFAGRLALPRVQNRLAELVLSPEEAAQALRAFRPPQNALAVPDDLAELPYRVAPAISAR